MCLEVVHTMILSNDLFLYLNCFVSKSKCAINIYEFEMIYNDTIGF